jgi:hypothetical protein
MSNKTRSAGTVNQWLWRQVERHQRRPNWQRMLIRVLWVVVATAVVYLWISMWDCPIC